MDCKNSNGLISIIVPVYNVEKYLSKCLDSIINQTYKNLEIILIDDGSTDKSGEICDKYKNEDKRIIVIHQLNGGVSAARNTGIGVAKGRYILFIDSDDWIEKDYVSSLFTYAGDDTIVCCGYKRIFDDKIIEHSVKKLDELNKVEFLNLLQDYELKKHKDFYINPIGNYLWNKLIPTKILKQVNFPENHLYEDVYVLFKIIKLSNQIVILPQCIYNYVSHKDCIVNCITKKQAFESLDSRIEQEKDSAFNEQLLIQCRYLTLIKLVYMYINCFKGKINLFENDKIILSKLINERSRNLKVIHVKIKLYLFLIMRFPNLAKFLCKAKCFYENL